MRPVRGIVTSAIKVTDMKQLLLESGGICAFPDCHRLLVSADAPEEPGAVIAEVAHIVAESREGPRGSEPLSEDERNEPANLIVVCPEPCPSPKSRPRRNGLIPRWNNLNMTRELNQKSSPIG